jgi:peptide/nickel transport system permease protein
MACVYIIAIMALGLNLFLTFLLHVCARSSLKDVTDGWMTGNHLRAERAAPMMTPAMTSERLRSAFRSFRHSPTGMAALVVFAALLIIGLLAPVLATVQDPMSYDNLDSAFLDPSLEPSPEMDMIHPLGTDYIGRDIYSMWLLAAKNATLQAIAFVLIAMTIGVLVGTLAARVRRLEGGTYRILDNLTSTLFARTSASFPLLVLSVMIVAIYGDYNFMIQVFLLAWMYLWAWLLVARQSRPRDLVGSPGRPWRPSFTDVVAYSLSAAKFVVPMLLVVDTAIMTVGGFRPDTEPTWGSMLNYGYIYMADITGTWPHLVLPMVIGICALVVSVFVILDRMEYMIRTARAPPAHVADVPVDQPIQDHDQVASQV